jgi:hypothetical protein
VFVELTQIISRLCVTIIYMCRRITITYFGNITIQPEGNTCIICRKWTLLVPQSEILFPSMLNKTIKYFVFTIFKEIRYQVLPVIIKCINKCYTIGTVRYKQKYLFTTQLCISVCTIKILPHKYVFVADIQHNSLC